jgi:plastocyanin
MVLFALAAACQAPPDPAFRPDSVLQAELGLTLEDRVYRVRVSGGERERADPARISIEHGSYVEFVTTDWLIHEVIFELDSLSSDGHAFLERTNQLASSPLIEPDARYVLAFEGAPPGRYPYRLRGNGGEGRGVIVVAPRPLP